MKIKLTKKEINQAFDDALSGVTPEQGKPALPNLSEQVKQIVAKNKGVTPQ